MGTGGKLMIHELKLKPTHFVLSLTMTLARFDEDICEYISLLSNSQ